MLSTTQLFQNWGYCSILILVRQKLAYVLVYTTKHLLFIPSVDIPFSTFSIVVILSADQWQGWHWWEACTFKKLFFFCYCTAKIFVCGWVSWRFILRAQKFHVSLILLPSFRYCYHLFRYFRLVTLLFLGVNSLTLETSRHVPRSSSCLLLVPLPLLENYLISGIRSEDISRSAATAKISQAFIPSIWLPSL